MRGTEPDWKFEDTVCRVGDDTRLVCASMVPIRSRRSETLAILFVESCFPVNIVSLSLVSFPLPTVCCTLVTTGSLTVLSNVLDETIVLCTLVGGRTVLSNVLEKTLLFCTLVTVGGRPMLDVTLGGPVGG